MPARSHIRAFALTGLILLPSCGSDEQGSAWSYATPDASGDVTPSDAPADADAATVDVTQDAAPFDASDEETGSDAADAASGASLRIAVLSDLNGSYGSTTYGTPVHEAVAALRADIHPDIVLLTGDLVAGQQSGLDYPAMWAGFHAAVTDPLLADGIPVVVTPGNHDASAYAGYTEERAEFVAQWTEPTRIPAVTFVDASDYPLRYSFTYRGVFFIALDATKVGPLSTSQRDWVTAQLDAADGFAVKIAFGHIPIRPVAQGVDDEVLGDDALEASMANHEVAAYVSGHHHAYYPGVSGGLRQIAMGCLGSGPRALLGVMETSPRSLLRIDVEQDAVVSIDAYMGVGFGTLVERGTLPAEVNSGGQGMQRDDLAQ